MQRVSALLLHKRIPSFSTTTTTLTSSSFLLLSTNHHHHNDPVYNFKTRSPSAPPFQSAFNPLFHHSPAARTSTTTTSSRQDQTPPPLLLRDYIQQSLYHHTNGYFTTTDSTPILPGGGASPTTTHTHTPPTDYNEDDHDMNISQLDDARAYHQAVSDMYRSEPHGWLTPVQLFSPYLSRAIANYILQQQQSCHRVVSAVATDGDTTANNNNINNTVGGDSGGEYSGSSQTQTQKPIAIIEIGPGLGTLARDIVTVFERDHGWMMQRDSDTTTTSTTTTTGHAKHSNASNSSKHNNRGGLMLQYFMVDISHTLAQQQQMLMKPWIDRGIVHSVVGDITETRAATRLWDENHGSSSADDEQDGDNEVMSTVVDLLRRNGVEETEYDVFVICTEVLDNLPHDLIRLSASSSSSSSHPATCNSRLPSNTAIEQATVHFSSNDVHDRIGRFLDWQPCTDHLILDAITSFDMMSSHLANNTTNHNTHHHHQPQKQQSYFSSLSSFSSSHSSSPSLLSQWLTSLTNVSANVHEIWVPTVCHQLLSRLTRWLPHAKYVLTDFIHFPGTLPGRLAPVVQRVCRGHAVVYDCVHEAPFGQVDIMFPTHFERVVHAHQHLLLCNNSLPSPHSQTKGDNQVFNTPTDLSRSLKTPPTFDYSIMSQHDFFDRFVYCDDDRKQTTCRDGFNPIMHDFDNVSFLLIQ